MRNLAKILTIIILIKAILPKKKSIFSLDGGKSESMPLIIGDQNLPQFEASIWEMHNTILLSV